MNLTVNVCKGLVDIDSGLESVRAWHRALVQMLCREIVTAGLFGGYPFLIGYIEVD